MTIYEKLACVQQALKAPKSQTNTFGGYKYRSCEDVLEAVKPLLTQNKLVLLLSDNVQEIGGRVYIHATATLVDAETAENVCVTAYAREEESKKGMDASQVTGTSSSYARKYALNGLFCIDDAKDSDYTNRGPEPEKTRPAAKPDAMACADCGAAITENVLKYSSDFYGRPLCRNCQRKADKKL